MSLFGITTGLFGAIVLIIAVFETAFGGTSLDSIQSFVIGYGMVIVSAIDLKRED